MLTLHFCGPSVLRPWMAFCLWLTERAALYLCQTTWHSTCSTNRRSSSTPACTTSSMMRTGRSFTRIYPSRMVRHGCMCVWVHIRFYTLKCTPTHTQVHKWLNTWLLLHTHSYLFPISLHSTKWGIVGWRGTPAEEPHLQLSYAGELCSWSKSWAVRREARGTALRGDAVFCPHSAPSHDGGGRR